MFSYDLQIKCIINDHLAFLRNEELYGNLKLSFLYDFMNIDFNMLFFLGFHTKQI